MVLYRRILMLTAFYWIAPAAAHAGGALVCVAHDRSLRLTLNASYDYGVGDSVTDASGTLEIRTAATPEPLRTFAITKDMIQKVRIDNAMLHFDIVNSATNDGINFSATIRISGRRVAADKTTVRGTYKVLLEKSRNTDQTKSKPELGTPSLRPFASAAGYAECSIN